MHPWITTFLLVISGQKPWVSARKVRQWTCPRFISVVCGPTNQCLGDGMNVLLLPDALHQEPNLVDLGKVNLEQQALHQQPLETRDDRFLLLVTLCRVVQYQVGRLPRVLAPLFVYAVNGDTWWQISYRCIRLIDYRCEEGRWLFSYALKLHDNFEPYLLSSSETGVNSGMRSWKKHLSEWAQCQKAIGGIYFTKK